MIELSQADMQRRIDELHDLEQTALLQLGECHVRGRPIDEAWERLCDIRRVTEVLYAAQRYREATLPGNQESGSGV